MLMNISYDIIESAVISLIFDDETVKKIKVNVEDTIKVSFNKNGLRTNIDGIVKRIFIDDRGSHHHCPDPCHKPKWVMIVDGSSYGASALERVELDKILDIDIVKRANDTNIITSPVGDTNITDFRLVGNILQLSVDNAQTWLKVLTLPDEETTVNPDDQELANKVEAILPVSLRPDLKADLTNDIVNLVKSEIAADDIKQDPGAEDTKEEVVTENETV